MKFITIFISCVALAVSVFAYSPIIDGALADIQVRVIDENGVAVSKANVSVILYITPETTDIKRGNTDTNGFFAAQGNCIGEAYLRISKDGYYDTKLTPVFRTLPYSEAESRRRWSDEAELTVATLKCIRNPIKMTFHSFDYETIPATNAVVALDLETFKWCPPYGNGANEDIHLFYESWNCSTNRYSYGRKLTVTFPQSADGFYRMERDAFSQFPYAYSANTNAVYDKSFTLDLERVDGKFIKKELFSENKYLIFRVRTLTNNVGEVVDAKYGRIGEKTEHMFGLRMRAWFNSISNDTNLEDTRMR